MYYILSLSSPEATVAIPSFTESVHYSFILVFIKTFFISIYLFFFHVCIHSFIVLPIGHFIHSFIMSVVLSFYLFVLSIIHSCIHLPIRSPQDIDLFTGVLTELHVSGGGVGPTLECILGEQFQRLKYGDRFWYQGQATGFDAGKFIVLP